MGLVMNRASSLSKAKDSLHFVPPDDIHSVPCSAVLRLLEDPRALPVSARGSLPSWTLLTGELGSKILNLPHMGQQLPLNAVGASHHFLASDLFI